MVWPLPSAGKVTLVKLEMARQGENLQFYLLGLFGRSSKERPKGDLKDLAHMLKDPSVNARVNGCLIDVLQRHATGAINHIEQQ